jgi:hypothetical protein
VSRDFLLGPKRPRRNIRYQSRDTILLALKLKPEEWYPGFLGLGLAVFFFFFFFGVPFEGGLYPAIGYLLI